MPDKEMKTMTEALRCAISQSGESLQSLERLTGVQRRSISRFLRGDQSLRLDIADRLAVHFGITVYMKGK